MINEQYELLKIETEISKVSLQVNDMLIETFQVKQYTKNTNHHHYNQPIFTTNIEERTLLKMLDILKIWQ